MRIIRSPATWLPLAVAALLPLAATGQTLTISEGVQTYVSLTNTTVILSNRCELRLTTTNNPFPGCIINLNSADAWLVLPGIKPSVVVSTYLGQVLVSGAGAVADGNVRVVQYASGALVIPQAPGFQPLHAFSGPYFTGSSMLFNQYTLYTGGALGAMDRAISSFKLKRGYMATLAQNENGTGVSQCYIAQDGDLEVGILPTGLNNKIRFVRVFPWRWTSKKGIAGNIADGLNVGWFYNWNIDQNSTRDLEYVPIRQNQFWPGLNQNWQARGANTLLGYNEPDRPDQANMTVGQALASWPDLLGTGLRVGAPAVSDGGLSWLYSFMAQADAAGVRVDFVPVHYYRCVDPADPDAAATQFYNFLKGIHDQVNRPLWVTEWNNGANWTGCGDPTFAQQQAAIAKMIQMLDSTPFVERYALYNWVEDVRRVKWDDGTLTDAGITYRDEVSPSSYLQELPSVGSRSIVQLPFENSTLDTSGFGNNGLAIGFPGYTAGQRGQAIQLDGTNNFVQLPANVAHSAAFSFAAWVYWDGGGNWQRIFDFGNDTSHYLFLTPSSGSGTLRFAIRNGGGEQIVETTGLPAGQWRHVAVTLAANVGRIYVNGVQVAAASITITPSQFNPAKNFLGESQFPADPLLRGRLDEVLIADYAFTGTQVASLTTNSPPQFTTNLISGGGATQGQAYSNSIAGLAFDPDAGDTISYSKATGPAWLTVATNGTLTGTPGFTDDGTNEFTVCATDAAGASAFAVLTIDLPTILGNGTWIVDTSGNWSEANKWSGNFPANGIGNTADFSTLNITADRTVTLDSSRSIGTLRFGDTSGGQAWTLNASGGSTLTLDTGAATSPSIVVNQGTATLAGPLAGVAGLAKSGSGTLVLSGANSLSGTFYIDTSNTGANEGIVRAAGPGALASATSLQIRNNNSGSSTLQLDGSSGDITTPAATSLSGRNVNVVAIQNLSGSNSLGGGLSINVGGSFYVLQSDAGTLNLGGTITSLATGTRTFTFQGNGDFNVSGSIQNGSATNNLTKTGAGWLTLSGANTFTGTNRIVGGTLRLAHSAALQNGILNLDPTDSGTLSFGTLTGAAIGGLIGTRGFALTNTSNEPVTVTLGGNSQNLNYTGVLTGPGGLSKINAGTQTLSGASTFTGSTRISGGAITLGNSLALQNSVVIADGGNLNFGSLGSATVGGLSGSQNIALTNGSSAPVALTVRAAAQDSGYAGVLSGSGSLTKTGAGSFVLSGANTYSGNTIVNGGTLKLSREPIVKFTFDEVSGSSNGSVVTNRGTGGSAMNGVVVNGATGVSFVAGKTGNALTLAGDGSYVSIPGRVTTLDDTPGTAWTLVLWMKTTQAGAGYAYQGGGGWVSGNTAFYLNQGNTSSGTRAGAVRWGGGWLTGNAGINNGAWRFVAITDANGTKNIYVDGNLDATTTSWTHFSAGSQFWIGGTADNGDGVAKMNGQIDEVSIYSRALSLTELRSLTNATTPPAGNFGGQLPPATALSVSAGAVFDLGGNSQTIASLADSSGGGLVTNSSATPATLTLGGTSGSATFSGMIADNVTSGAISLVKNGGGTEILSGANDIQGTTTINAGAMLVNGSLDASAVNVVGGTLGGSGLVGGPVSVQAGGRISPGTSIGTLTLSAAPTLGGAILMEINRTNLPSSDHIDISSGDLNYGGTLTVTNIGPALQSGDSFPLFTASGFGGAFVATNLPPLTSGLGWNFDPNTGVLSVIQTVATHPTNISCTIGGGAITVSWPADHLGWRLQAQTNSLGEGLGTNWATVSGSTNVTEVTLPIDAANGSVFFRLIFP